MLRGMDFWQKDRERAELVDGGLRVLRDTTQQGKPALKMWRPKAVKPFVNAYFRSEENREAYVAEQIKSLREHKARIEERKAAAKGTPEQVEAVKVGAIFHYSWGYDQTNAQFYQVIEKQGRLVTLRELKQESVPGSQGFMSEQVRPVPNAFLDEGPIEKVLKFGYQSEPCVSMPHGCCSLWKGGATYSSWYA